MDKQFKLQLDSVSPSPLYRQIYECYRSRICDGTLRAGAVFPSERALIKEFGLARTTLRGALDALEKEGLICRRQGIGTFVAEQKSWRAHQEAILLGIIAWNESYGGYLKKIFGHVCRPRVWACGFMQ